MDASDWSAEQALKDAIAGAQMGEVVALTPEALSYPGELFDGQTEIELRREMMRMFTAPQDPPDFELDAVCVGQNYDAEEDRTIYLLAQDTADRGVIYLVSPSPTAS